MIYLFTRILLIVFLSQHLRFGTNVATALDSAATENITETGLVEETGTEIFFIL